MKKIMGAAIIAALAAGTSAYAANPFADVSTSDWAYQAVSDLSSQGIVEGYPDGTFKGQTNITRYEMAQIVARLMAKEDQYNAEQRATIDKLAGEYADELDSLGVKVSNLEKKVGNISWSGDARMRYQRGLGTTDFYGNAVSAADKRQDHYDGRIRLNVKGQVNEKVSVEGRFLTNMYFKDAGEDDGTTDMDRLHVVYTPNEKTSIDVGRTDLWLGQTGILYDDTFDGIKISYDTGHFGAEAGYGRMIEMNDNAKNLLAGDLYTGIVDNSKLESYYIKVSGKTGPVQLSAFYLDFVQDSETLINRNKRYGYGDKGVSLWGLGSAIQFGSQFMLDGDYIQNRGTYQNGVYRIGPDIDKPALWTVGLTYGHVDADKPGTYSIGIRYVDADYMSYFGSSTLDMTDYLNNSWNFMVKNNRLTEMGGTSFWLLKTGVAVAKNVELDAYYYFNAKFKQQINVGNHPGSVDADDIYGIELNYTF